MSTVALMSTTAPIRMTPRSTPAADGLPAGTVVRSRLHLTRRGRAVLTGLAALPLVIGAFVFALNGGVAAAGGDGPGTTFEYVTVQSGQSLWELAEGLAPSADPREVIADIVSLNQLGTTVLEPGQRLAIPTQY